MEQLQGTISYIVSLLHIPEVNWSDIIEILILAYLLYHFILWIKNTRAYSLLRGAVVVVAFVILAYVFEMNTILWIVQNVTGIAATMLIVILQPELRNAILELGEKNFFTDLLRFDNGAQRDGLFSDRTLAEIVRACVSMGKVKTGALIVIEQNTPLGEYERTGIDVDAIVTSQLLINIFEKNTPLHDGAVIIRGDRVVSATCYLPLSDNRLDKDLGTRHRAAVGISETTDSVTVVVSEETGQISVAYKGKLERGFDQASLKVRLAEAQKKSEHEEKHGILMPWKGKDSDE